jgi:hypothetical protein
MSTEFIFVFTYVAERFECTVYWLCWWFIAVRYEFKHSVILEPLVKWD